MLSTWSSRFTRFKKEWKEREKTPHRAGRKGIDKNRFTYITSIINSVLNANAVNSWHNLYSICMALVWYYVRTLCANANTFKHINFAFNSFSSVSLRTSLCCVWVCVCICVSVPKSLSLSLARSPLLCFSWHVCFRASFYFNYHPTFRSVTIRTDTSEENERCKENKRQANCMDGKIPITCLFWCKWNLWNECIALMWFVAVFRKD